MGSRAEITRAWDLFHLGAFAEAESLLASIPEKPETIQIHLSIANRRDDYDAKRKFGALLARCEEPRLATLGRANENSALAILGLPLNEWLPATSNWAKAEVAYSRAVIAFVGGTPDAVRSELAQALPQTAEQRVRYAALRAWLYGLREQFEKQGTFLLHALSLAIDQDVDRGLQASIAASLAPLARELDLQGLGDRAEALLGSVAWPQDISTSRFYTQRALAWRKALGGGWIPALHLLDGALGIAPDAMRRGLIFADRARISNAVGESLTAVSSRANAFDSFDQIDWNRARIDEQTGVFAAMDVLGAERELAQRLFDRADAVNVYTFAGLGRGRRPIAFREFALSHLSDGDEALEHAQAAYKIFKELKYIHRATSCALRAVELGGGARWRERVERLIADYPRSLAAREYERMTAPVARIRGRMREVAELLVSSNKTAREIGEALGMAEGTVRVHIKHMNKILNVQSRSQLVRLFLGATSAA